MNEEGNHRQWSDDLFYSTSIPSSYSSPSTSTQDSENLPSPLPSNRYRLSRTSPRLYRQTARTPLSNLKQTPEGKLVVLQDPVVRNLEFQLDL